MIGAIQAKKPNTPKPTSAPALAKQLNQLIFIADKDKQDWQPPLQAKVIRDTINQGISKATGAKGLVVAKIVQSLKGNYVITTLEPYTA